MLLANVLERCSCPQNHVKDILLGFPPNTPSAECDVMLHRVKALRVLPGDCWSMLTSLPQQAKFVMLCLGRELDTTAWRFGTSAAAERPWTAALRA